jgi:hypothetical protein
VLDVESRAGRDHDPLAGHLDRERAAAFDRARKAAQLGGELAAR